VLAPDAEELVVKYLSTNGLSNVSVELPANPPMPFYLINRVAGGDDGVTDQAIVSVHCFNTTHTGASDAARAMNRLMNFWVLTPRVVVSVGGNNVYIDSVRTVESPIWRHYSDEFNIHRYVARYEICLRMNQTT
jgi:hypothetical protein